MMRNRSGFTMVELMIVAVILGLLTTIAVVQTSRLRQRAYGGVLKSDLRNLAVAQESHFYDNLVYAADPADLYLRGWRETEGTSIEILESTLVGWSAEARHANTDLRCYVFIREGAPVGMATQEGVVACG